MVKIENHTGIYSRLTVRENLMYFGRRRGMASAPLRERADEVFAALALGSIADRRTDGFSQGERMKTSLARAILYSARKAVVLLSSKRLQRDEIIYGN